MTNDGKTKPPSADDVLRRMLATPPKPHAPIPRKKAKKPAKK